MKTIPIQAVTPEFSECEESRIMGMRALRKLDFPEMKFSLYFLATFSSHPKRIKNLLA